MRKIFIDCGGHNGCSTKKFLNEWQNSNEFEIHTFECNPKFWKYYQNLPTTLHKDAVSNYSGIINFYAQKNNIAAGSSTIKEKSNLGCWTQSQIPCINFSEFISNSFSKNDYIILKMDIEGKEYDVLDQMIFDNSISYINELFIEWHYYKLNIPNIKKRHTSLIENLSRFNLTPKNWDALNYR